jgi:CheY-like chemotaxis protein
MGQAQPKRRTALIVEDDAELRGLTAALLEEEQLDTIECESAEAALGVLLIGGKDIAMIFADVRPARSDGRHRSGMGGQGALAAASHGSHLGASARA